MNAEEIQAAIGAHGMWKGRLTSAIDSGRSDVTPDHVEPDNICAFGKWLYALPQGERNSEHFQKVRPLHAAFHREAANVLRLALNGKKPEARKCMAPGGSYLSASAKLTEAMMAWQKALAVKTH